MSHLTISLDDDRWFRPGDRITGTITWHGEDGIDDVELHLCWFTQGKGTEDAGIAASHQVPHPGPTGNERFELVAPDGPYSFSGTLISLSWALELVVNPGGACERVDILIGPRPAEILLEPVD